MLTSARNPTIAKAARLRKRALRDHDRLFLLEGAQVVGEALDAGRLERLFTADDLDPIALRARHAGVETHHVAGEVVRHLTSTVTPQALVGIAAFVDVGLDEAMERASEHDPAGCVALLHEVRDPGNAGTVLRSADAADAGAVVFSETSVDVYNPKTIRASAGSVFHLPIVRGASTLDAIGMAKAAGGRVLAMTTGGDGDLYRADLSGPVVFVFGNEAHGLSE
ncbi:MAG: RNA methyltransferase, partial [Actinobacteria bacterium]|nr:RNA methyltransferase [Actinomycetota bacterium]